MEKKFICKGCSHINPLLNMYCDLGFDLGKDEFAQTVPMYSVITGKVCRWKTVK